MAKADSPELRAFATNTLPTLRQHRAMIEKDKLVVDKMKQAPRASAQRNRTR